MKRHLWIGTADIIDLHMKKGNCSTPFLAIIDGLIKKGVEVRLIHAKEPGPAFREDFDSIGVVIVRDGKIVDKFYSLIYPEPDYFTYWTTQVHGLTMDDVQNAPVSPRFGNRLIR